MPVTNDTGSSGWGERESNGQELCPAQSPKSVSKDNNSEKLPPPGAANKLNDIAHLPDISYWFLFSVKNPIGIHSPSPQRNAMMKILHRVGPLAPLQFDDLQTL